MNTCNKNIKIFLLGKNETENYAAEELSKYLELMTSCEEIDIMQKQSFDCNNLEINNGISIGLFDELVISSLGVEDSLLDDEIYIDISEGKGIIAGINPRSVLMAVYRMLSENGCAWVRPGNDGEYIPQKSLNDINVRMHEKPSYRHRGIDFIGAKSREDILEMIRWAPKLGFNTIFFEGLYPYKTDFYKVWYDHFENSFKKPESLSIQTRKHFLTEAINEIKKLGLLYHSAGHGFNCEALGLAPGHKGAVDEEIRNHLAMVNGKREIRLNACATNLCYSNPETRKILISYMVDFAKGNPEIDFMHVWLADGTNNHCECDGCREILPSDLYIKMLNELDEQLTSNNLSIKVVIISYTDLIWKPTHERLKNPQRFTLTHAPFFRSYRKSFKYAGKLPELPAFKKNSNIYPLSIEENVAYINDWNEYFGGDNFLFEYHFWLAQYADPGQYQISQVLYDDITSFKKLGVNGYISCQQVRSFMPTGLGMYIMGKTLWNENASFDTISNEYFKSAFGKDWDKCLKYVKWISKLFDPDLKDEKGPLKKEDSERYEEIIRHVEDFRDTIDENILEDNCCHSASWNYLKLHADMVTLLALAYENKSLGKKCKAIAIWKLLEKNIYEHEDQMEKVFDVFAYLRWQKNCFVAEGEKCN